MQGITTTTRTAAAAVAAAGLLTTVTAGALEWQTRPTVSLASTGDTNYRLSTVDEREVNSSRLDASANIEGRSDRLRLELRPRYHAINYSDDREFDRNDKYLYSSLDVGGERQRVSFSADYARDGTLTNALEDTGYTEIDAERERDIYGLEYTAASSERGQFYVSLGNQTVDYIDDLVDSPLVDYDYASVGFGYLHQLSERSSLTFSLTGSELDSQSFFGTSETLGLALLFEREMSDSLTLRIGGGAYESRRPDFEFLFPDDRNSTLDFQIEKRWELWSVTTSLAADIEPSAYGVMHRRESAGISVRRRFSERIDAGLGLSAGYVKSEDPLIYNEDRDYGSGTLNINWRVAERLYLSFDVGSRYQQYMDYDRARSTFGRVALTYRGRGS